MCLSVYPVFTKPTDCSMALRGDLLYRDPPRSLNRCQKLRVRINLLMLVSKQWQLLSRTAQNSSFVDNCAKELLYGIAWALDNGWRYSNTVFALLQSAKKFSKLTHLQFLPYCFQGCICDISTYVRHWDSSPSTSVFFLLASPMMITYGRNV